MVIEVNLIIRNIALFLYKTNLTYLFMPDPNFLGRLSAKILLFAH
jgi:hypothetical protein